MILYKQAGCLWVEMARRSFVSVMKIRINEKKNDFDPNSVAYLQYYAHAEAAIPLRRVGTCEDHIVPLIMFMASDKATFINGAVIVADGGYSHTCNCPWIYSDERILFIKYITLYLF